MDPMSLIPTAIGALGLCFGIYHSRRAYRLTREIATTQGHLSTPDLELRFHGYRLNIHFVILAPILGKRIIEFPMDLRLGNRGSKTAREVDLLLRFPKPIIYGGSEKSTFKIQVPKEGCKFQTVASSENLETQLLSIPSLNPGAGVGLDASLSIRTETIHHSRSTFEFADGPHEIGFEVYYEWVIAVVVTQADRPAFSSAITLTVLDLKSDSPTEAMHRYNQARARDGEARPKTKQPAVVFIIDEDALEQDPQFPELPVSRVKPGALRAAEGYRTSTGYLLPALGVTPPKTRA